jgi:uncharacterized protein
MDLCLVVDHACNLRCSYCYTGEKFRKPMSLQTAERAIELALAQSPTSLELSFFGGEPLLHLELLQAATRYAQERLATSSTPVPLTVVLNTNAVLVDERVKEWVRALPHVAAFVSLDGPAAVHDRFRKDAAGKGSHDAVVAGLGRLRVAGVKVAPVAVVNPETVDSLGDVVRALLATGCERLTLTPNFRAAWDEASLERCARGMLQAAEVWMEHLRAGGRQLLEPLTGKILAHLHGGTPCPARCQLAGREVAVAPSGNLYPCAQIVGEDSDASLLIGHVNSGFDRQAIARLQQSKERVDTTCGDCALRSRCDSHCGCRHVALTGEMGRITGVLCEYEALLVEAADHVGNTLHAEGNETFRALFYEQRWRPATGAVLVPLRLSRDQSPQV